MQDHMIPNTPIYPQSSVWANRPLATMQTQQDLRLMAAQYGIRPPQVNMLPSDILINQDYAIQAQQQNFAFGNFPPVDGDVLPTTWAQGRSAWLSPKPSVPAWQPQPTTVGGFGFAPLSSFAQPSVRSAFDAHQGTVLAGQVPVQSLPVAPMFRPQQFSLLGGCKCKNMGSLGSASSPTTPVVQPPSQQGTFGVLLLGAALGAIAFKIYREQKESKPKSSDSAPIMEMPQP